MKPKTLKTMKKVKYYMMMLCLVLAGGMVSNCGGDGDGGSTSSSTDKKGGSSIESMLVGNWAKIAMYTYDDGTTASFYYQFNSDKTGTWRRVQGNKSWWYNFTWSANFSEGKYWLHESVTAVSAGMDDWGSTKVGKMNNWEISITDNVLTAGGIDYSKN